MRRVLTAAGMVSAIAFVSVCAHFLLIEAGREVVTLRTESADGTWQETRLWVVDYKGDVWLHSAGTEWHNRFEGGSRVELDRNGLTERYEAIPDPSKHPEIDAELRAKYGVADRWVRLLAPCDETVLPVRLRKQGI